MEELFGVIPIEIKKYDGSNFPSIINDILRKFKNKAFFGGGSLLHDAFFKDEHWVSRVDYDIWCRDIYFKEIISYLEEKKLQKINHSNYEVIYYERFNIKELVEYTFEIDGKKYIIQLINIGANFFTLIDKIDFTFNTVLYNGEDLIFFRTTEAQILQKQGDLQVYIKTNKCECNDCKNKGISHKQINRIRKYKARGFEITNFCPFCKSNTYQLINIPHFESCILNITYPSYVLRLESTQFQLIKDIIQNTKNIHIILCCLNIIARTMQMEDFLYFFYEKKCHIILNTNLKLFNDILIDFTINGQFTFFKLFFDLLKTKIKITSSQIQILFRKASAYNCINIARYIASHCQRYELFIFEDKIYQYNILTVFEHYIKYKDIQVILDECPSIILFEKEEDNEDSICSICKENQINIRLPCGHEFCDCIFTYFATTFQMKCGICRIEYNSL